MELDHVESSQDNKQLSADIERVRHMTHTCLQVLVSPGSGIIEDVRVV